MRDDAWPQHCRAALVRSVSAAAAQFPNPGEEAPKRVHDVRKTLKEGRAIARLFLDCVGEPARVTITTLAATRRFSRNRTVRRKSSRVISERTVFLENCRNSLSVCLISSCDFRLWLSL